MKQKLIKILEAKLGGAEDNLYRSNMSCRGCDDEEMNEPYYASGKSRLEVHNGYKEEVVEMKELLDYVNDLPE